MIKMYGRKQYFRGSAFIYIYIYIYITSVVSPKWYAQTDCKMFRSNGKPKGLKLNPKQYLEYSKKTQSRQCGNFLPTLFVYFILSALFYLFDKYFNISGIIIIINDTVSILSKKKKKMIPLVYHSFPSVFFNKKTKTL